MKANGLNGNERPFIVGRRSSRLRQSTLSRNAKECVLFSVARLQQKSQRSAAATTVASNCIGEERVKEACVCRYPRCAENPIESAAVSSLPVRPLSAKPCLRPGHRFGTRA